MAVTSQLNVSMLNDAGEVVNWPMTSGDTTVTKTPILLPSILPPGYQYFGAGFGDNAETHVIQGGSIFNLSRTDQGDSTIDVSFLDHIYLLGGMASWSGADLGDYLRCKMIAPASTYSEESGDGKQGITLTALGGGAYRLRPVDSSPTHYVDPVKYTKTEKAKYLTPVPSFDASGNPTGWWDVDYSLTPSIFPHRNSENVIEQTGGYHLYSFDVNLWMHVNVPLLGSATDHICPEVMKYKKIFPEWVFRTTLHRETSGTVKAVWYMHLARKRAFVT